MHKLRKNSGPKKPHLTYKRGKEQNHHLFKDVVDEEY